MKKVSFLFILCSFVLKAEMGSVEGRIVDSQTNEPIVYANVFMSGTTIGSTTNDDGEYKIRSIPEGNYKLVISVVGYESISKIIRVNNNDELVLDFELKRKVYELDEVAIVGEYDEEFEKNYKIFRSHFLGTSRNATNCEIVNPGIIDFVKKDNGNLEATSEEMLEIINHSLGYNIRVQLKKFELTSQGEVYYAGETLFQEIDTNDTYVKNQWENNREEAYLGSTRHFLKSLYENNSYSDGFRIYLTRRPTWNAVYELMQHEQPISYELNKNILPRPDGYKKLILDETILIKYTGEVEAAEYYAYRETMDSNINEILPYQISWIKLINDECEFNENGLLKYPDNSIKVFGYWGWLKMGDMLPFDYEPIDE